jgi:hypothetical protein
MPQNIGVLHIAQHGEQQIKFFHAGPSLRL